MRTNTTTRVVARATGAAFWTEMARRRARLGDAAFEEALVLDLASADVARHVIHQLAVVDPNSEWALHPEVAETLELDGEPISADDVAWNVIAHLEGVA